LGLTLVVDCFSLLVLLFGVGRLLLVVSSLVLLVLVCGVAAGLVLGRLLG
jgi:hypothetical protein